MAETLPREEKQHGRMQGHEEEIEALPEQELVPIQTVTTNEDDLDYHAVGGESIEDMPDHYFRSWKFMGTILGFVLGFASSYQLFYASSTVLYSFIDPQLGPSPNIIWVLLAYQLAQTATFPVVGRLSDIFGRRYFFLVGTAISFVGLMTGGRASSVNMLIAGQAIAGVGGGFQQTCLSALPELVPRKYRFRAVATCLCGLAPLTFFMPVISITIAENTEQSWRWSWYLCSIMAFMSWCLLFFCYFPPKFDQLHKNQTKKGILLSLDWVGFIMFIGGITVTLLGISWGGQVYPWKSAHVITSLVVGPLAIVVFFLWETRIDEHNQIVPLYLVKDRSFVALTGAVCVASMITLAVIVLGTQETTLLFGASLKTAGWITCTQTAGPQTGCVLGGILVHHIKRTKIQLIVVCIVFTAFVGGLAGVGPEDEGMFIAFALISAMASGYIEVITLAGAPMEGKDRDVGVATAVVASFRTIFTSVAQAIYIAVLTNKATSEVPAKVIPAAKSAGLPETAIPDLLKALASKSAAALEAVPGVTPSILAAVAAAAKDAYKVAFQLNYLISLAFGGLAIIAACSVRSLDGHLNTSVARRLQHLESTEAANESKQIEA